MNREEVSNKTINNVLYKRLVILKVNLNTNLWYEIIKVTM